MPIINFACMLLLHYTGSTNWAYVSDKLNQFAILLPLIKSAAWPGCFNENFIELVVQLKKLKPFDHLGTISNRIMLKMHVNYFFTHAD